MIINSLLVTNTLTKKAINKDNVLLMMNKANPTTKLEQAMVVFGPFSLHSSHTFYAKKAVIPTAQISELVSQSFSRILVDFLLFNVLLTP